jgi:hypothetical protein
MNGPAGRRCQGVADALRPNEPESHSSATQADGTKNAEGYKLLKKGELLPNSVLGSSAKLP